MEDVKVEALGLFANSKPAWPQSFEKFIDVAGIDLDTNLKSHAFVGGDERIRHLFGWDEGYE